MESYDYKKYTWIAGTFALAGLFFASLAVGASEWKSVKHPNGTQATITVSGEGEVTALPDIATVTVTVRESAKTVPEAQKATEAKVKAAIASLSALGVEQKDQKTLSYTVNPKYENVAVMSPTYYPGTMSNPKIVGYEAVQTIEIKVRKIDSAGEIVGALGAANITEISGPQFEVDDMEKAQADAKVKAIAAAKEKAKATAKALGVSLGEVTSFSEDNGGYYPMYYKTDSAMGSAAVAPMSASLPQGESVIKSRVSITYSLN